MSDLLADFDTMDNDILMHLHKKFCINETSLKLFSSYLNCRTQREVVMTAMIDKRPIYCGLQQGTVLEHVLFFMHTMPLEDIISHNGWQYMMYDDGIQFHIT